MKYYQHHIGDYRADTGHLSLLEHGIYRQLIDLYYLNEGPLDGDTDRLGRLLCVRNADEMRTLCDLLAEFFILQDDGYHHPRCDREIERLHGKSIKASESAKARWSHKKQMVTDKCDRNANALKTHSDRNAKAMLPINPLTQDIPPLTPPSVEGLDQDAWDRWTHYRKQIRKPLKEASLHAAQKKLASHGEEQAAVVEQSIANGWTGLFPLKTNGGHSAARRRNSAEEIHDTLKQIHGSSRE